MPSPIQNPQCSIPASFRSAFLLILTLSATSQLPRLAAADGEVVSLRREPLQLLSAEKFQVDLALHPLRLQSINATADGQVLNVQVAPGEAVAIQRDCVRLDDTRQQEVVRRATALMEVAKIELKIAGKGGDEDAEALAKAKVEVAEAELKLATLDLEALNCRSPFAGLVVEQRAFPGQVVRMGDPLLILADTSELTAQIPVDRSSTKVGQEIEILTDQNAIKGKVTALLPPTDAIAPLRQIIPSLATAVVIIDNANAKLVPGQAVYSRLVPQDAVTLVPADVISSHTEGRRKVQVIRNEIVRDVVIEALAQKGTDKVYISGPFSNADELLISSTQPLKDGQKITPSDGPPEPAKGAAAPTTPGAKTTPATPTTKPGGGL